MDISHIISSLNEPQRLAVTSEADRLLVLAGAGSGKTRVLVHRIAWLIQAENHSPFEILAVTFTNKAAAEMRYRIEDLLNIPVSGMWVGTFHGLAHRLLRTHWQDAKLPQSFQILDSDDQLRLIKRIMKEQGIDDARIPPKQVQWYINHCKDEGRRADHIEEFDMIAKWQLQIYHSYEDACQRGGMVDFAELLLRAHELWLHNPKLLKHYQERFRHILVDEFQDTNTIQNAWLQLLTTGTTNKMTIVGDDDQSIYGWRGARIEHIQEFDRDFPNADIIRLEQNYRSTGVILAAANSVIRKNESRLGKELWTEASDGDLITVYAAFNELDEARFVAEQIQNWVDDGNSRSEVAILYRSNAQSRVMEEALLRCSIPYRIYGGLRFFDRAEIKNAMSYLRLVEYRNDDTAFERVVNVPPRGIGNRTVEKVREVARDEGSSLWSAAMKVAEEKLLPARAANAIKDFVALINLLDESTQGLALSEQAEHVIESSTLLAHHKNEKGEKGQTRVENLKELVSACQQFGSEVELEGDQSLLSAFVDHAVLESGEGQADEFEDSVQLMTLHSAKGLEFPTVFMVGVEQGLFPSRMSIESLDKIEEERRLCYVGITRAMKHLTICYAESRRLYGKETLNRPSQFLREIPKETMQEVRVNTSVVRPTTFTAGGTNESSVTEHDGVFYEIGQQVRHSTFGEGYILNCEGSGPRARIEVNFDLEGNKWLMAQYAKLEIL
ncbi:MAG: DNA helicase II [Pseudomonadales bacterium]|nr:DNA helicase II [Pseudomonadales bacterium]